MHCEITDAWNQYLALIPPENKDIYYSEEYVKLYCNGSDEKALCIICTEGAQVLLMPYIRREVTGYNRVLNHCYYDFETAYGYGGPISNATDIKWIYNALICMNRFFASEHYLCGFVRFHPLLNNQQYCEKAMQVLYDRNTVCIDTFQTEEEIWTGQISSKNRNMIRKAEKNGCVFKAEYDFASLSEFQQLYEKTMRRLSADAFYFFGDEYFNSLKEGLCKHSFLGTVRMNGELICAAIFLYSTDYGHYHLEGSDSRYSSLGANNFLLWHAAKEMRTLGVQRFHLGGGYNSDLENSLLKFKKAFSNHLTDFYIGKNVFDWTKYQAVCESWEKRNPEKVDLYKNRLLKYRY